MFLIACPKCHTQFDGSGIAGTSFRCICGEEVAKVAPTPVDAAIHRCGACGASVSMDAERCDYCDGAIIRDRRQMGLICPECYARTPTGSRYCTSCGVEFRPQPVPAAGSELVCPSDGRTRLVPRPIGGVVAHECPHCAGLWVPGDEFDRLVNRALSACQAAPSSGLAGAKSPKRRWTGGKVEYRRCPCCKGVMNRKNFGGRSGIIVDWCGADGTWLDADELEEIAAYVMEGGLRPSIDPGLRDPEKGIVPPERVHALAEAERILAEARQVKSSTHRGPGKGSLLGDLLSSLLDL